MNPTVKAILARWNGDKTEAIQYCYTLIDGYPHLRKEYLAVIDILTGEKIEFNETETSESRRLPTLAKETREPTQTRQTGEEVDARESTPYTRAAAVSKI